MTGYAYLGKEDERFHVTLSSSFPSLLLFPLPACRRDHAHDLLWHVAFLLRLAQGGRGPALHQLPALGGAQDVVLHLAKGPGQVPEDGAGESRVQVCQAGLSAMEELLV